jgi:hypothetical protein
MSEPRAENPSDPQPPKDEAVPDKNSGPLSANAGASASTSRAGTEQTPEGTRRSTSAGSGARSAKRESASGRGAAARAAQFAPRDLTDGRDPLDWKSRYTDRCAKLGIVLEACYLAVLFVVIPLLLLSIWHHPNQPISSYMLAWLGGTLGGTLFSTKWLYHTVAKGLWHVDRRLWRLFTPHLSGALAFATYVIITSGLFPIVEKKTLESDSMAFSLGFIVGYFSDSATAKLTEIAETLFGTTRKP